jgi:hypothetical protein
LNKFEREKRKEKRVRYSNTTRPTCLLAQDSEQELEFEGGDLEMHPPSQSMVVDAAASQDWDAVFESNCAQILFEGSDNDKVHFFNRVMQSVINTFTSPQTAFCPTLMNFTVSL